jgi:hypothetical protein
LKSLAYCTDAVLEAAEEQQEAAAGAQPQKRAEAKEAFSRPELQAYLKRNVETLRKTAGQHEATGAELAAFLRKAAELLASAETLLEAPGPLDLEDLERRLTILDEKVHAALLTHAPEKLLLKISREVDSQLSTYRRRMKAEQLALVEKQYSQKRLLDEYQLPRLSLYYFS